jgi:hypothetical protein
LRKKRGEARIHFEWTSEIVINDNGWRLHLFVVEEAETRASQARQGGNSRKTGMSEAFISTADRVGENRERETLDKTSSDF